MTPTARRFAPLLLCCTLSAWPATARQDSPVAAAIEVPVATSHPFDARHSAFGFELRTRWGQRVAGVFPRYEGEVVRLADGRHRVRILLHTDSVVVEDSRRYTAIARGPDFFDAGRYPYIEFASDPHPYELVRTGGRMRGRLTIHGVSRVETFYIAPATCERPGYDCDVVASGSVSREDYNLSGWRFALLDRVRFSLRVRLQPEATP